MMTPQPKQPDPPLEAPTRAAMLRKEYGRLKSELAGEVGPSCPAMNRLMFSLGEQGNCKVTLHIRNEAEQVVMEPADVARLHNWLTHWFGAVKP